ncbi:Alpha/Beta hydrolase protein [Mycena olivaceomarginata]|nr:Alpha/Beta hydrolase protein [Mycena olivaceomarginata]
MALLPFVVANIRDIHTRAVAPGHFVTSADGTRIFAEARGNPSKPVIVFIHGFGIGAMAFNEIFDDPLWLLQVRYDTRGHGRSDKPNNAAAWVSQRLAEDFDAVVQKLQFEQTIWTHIADILSFHPSDYIAGIIYDAAAPDMTSLFNIGSPAALPLIPSLTQTTNVTQFQATYIDFINLCHPGPRALPLLAIFGADDKIIMKQAALDAMAGWQRLTVVTLPNAEHFTWISRPVLFRRQFCSGLLKMLNLR